MISIGNEDFFYKYLRRKSTMAREEVKTRHVIPLFSTCTIDSDQKKNQTLQVYTFSEILIYCKNLKNTVLLGIKVRVEKKIVQHLNLFAAFALNYFLYCLLATRSFQIYMIILVFSFQNIQPFEYACLLTNSSKNFFAIDFYILHNQLQLHIREHFCLCFTSSTYLSSAHWIGAR